MRNKKEDIVECKFEGEIAIMIDKVSDMHKALMGNGRIGLIDQFNQFKGAVKFGGFILGLSCVGSFVATFFG